MRALFIFSCVFLVSAISTVAAAEKQAVFAGGCFWCMEGPFDKLDGVVSTTSGFSGGTIENPSYKQVSKGGTGHIEVIEVVYDDEKVSYETLLETYWANVDPLDGEGQFCDRGHTYKPAIFYVDDAQQALASTSKEKVSGILEKPIAAEIIAFDQFYPAEDYHQDYYQTNATKYKFYRWRCGRDARLEEVWGDQAGKAISVF